MLKDRDIKIGAQPIIWSNDDFQELGGDIPLERCLGEMKSAGYAGTELGHKFPAEPDKLAQVLKSHGLDLISGWHSAYLLSRGLKEETADFQKHLELLKALGSPVAIVAECTGRIYNDPQKALTNGDAAGLSQQDWKQLSSGLETFARQAADQGIILVYHHHMGTVIQNLPEIERLMERTDTVKLLVDTGHLAMAGIEPLGVFERYAGRIGHVHLKDIRPEVAARARKERYSFARAVKEGVFTVPGDGGIEYKPIFSALAGMDYKGWMVVEAEQDPSRADPFKFAKMAREYIRAETGL